MLNPANLQAILNNTQLQNRDQPLYQFLNSLVSTLVSVTNNITNISGPGGSAGPPGPQGPPGIPGFIFNRDGNGGGSGLVVPGQTGPSGNAGATGAQGPMGPAVHFSNQYDTNYLFRIVNTFVGGFGANLGEAQLVVTNTQMQSLNTTPLTIVAAPGAGLLHIPIAVAWHKNFTAGGGANNPALSIRYAAVALDVTSQVAIAGVSADNRYGFLPMNGAFGSSTTDLSNKDMVVYFSANLAGGNAANTLTVNLLYYLFSEAAP